MRRHMHIEPSSPSAGGTFVNNVERIGKAAVQVSGAIHTMYQVGKGNGTVARYAAPLLGFLQRLSKKMFGRVTRDSIRHAAGGVRGHIQHAYSTARHWGSMLDRAIQVGSKVHSAAQPALQYYAPRVEKRVSSGVRAVKGEYDNIRDRLVNENERAGDAIATVSRKLPDIGL